MALIDFTLFNARRFYSSTGNPSGLKRLRICKNLKIIIIIFIIIINISNIFLTILGDLNNAYLWINSTGMPTSMVLGLSFNFSDIDPNAPTTTEATFVLTPQIFLLLLQDLGTFQLFHLIYHHHHHHHHYYYYYYSIYYCYYDYNYHYLIKEKSMAHLFT